MHYRQMNQGILQSPCLGLLPRFAERQYDWTSIGHVNVIPKRISLDLTHSDKVKVRRSKYNKTSISCQCFLFQKWMNNSNRNNSI